MMKLRAVFGWLGNLRLMDRRKLQEVKVEKLIDPQDILDMLIKGNAYEDISPFTDDRTIMYNAGKQEVIRGLKTLIKRFG